MIPLGSEAKVFLALGGTDLRRGIDGLSMMVSGHLGRDPFSGHVFAFCNRQRNSVKLLVWDLCEESDYVKFTPENPFLFMTLALFHLT